MSKRPDDGATTNGTVNVAHTGTPRHPRRIGHGLTTMKRAVAKLGARAVDGRTAVGKALDRWRNALIQDSINAWLVTQPSLVDKRRRALLPVVRERQQLADALARHLGQLGLERVVRQKSFYEIIDEIKSDVRNNPPLEDDDPELDDDDGPAPDDP